MMRQIIRIDEDKCNGCGLCAQACHEGAIGMVEGKAKLLREDYCDGLGDCLPVCPTGAISFEKREAAAFVENAQAAAPLKTNSRLGQWPVQIRLVPINAPYFNDAHVLVAADCSAYACGRFHEDFMADKVTLIGCPKLDAEDYSQKLTAILMNNHIQSITVTRMEVPCCGGIEYAVKKAVQNSGKPIPWQIVTITTDGRYTTTQGGK